MEKTFTIAAVSRLTGLNEHTLRAWERRYGVVQPVRGDTGRRVYTAADVERLRLLVQLLEHGHTIGRLAKLDAAQLGELLSETLLLKEPPPVFGDPQAEIISQAILEALSRYELANIHGLMQKARQRVSVRTFVLDIAAPLMAAAGHMVIDGRASIAQEHALSAIVKAHLSDMLFNLSRLNEETSPSAIGLATREGDLHEIGILIAGVLCAYYGWNVHYFGPNLPPDALGDALVAVKANAVLLGVVALPPGTVAWSVEDYVNRVGKIVSPCHEIWVGGSLVKQSDFSSLQQPWRHFETFFDLDRALCSAESPAR